MPLQSRWPTERPWRRLLLCALLATLLHLLLLALWGPRVETDGRSRITEPLVYTLPGSDRSAVSAVPAPPRQSVRRPRPGPPASPELSAAPVVPPPSAEAPADDAPAAAPAEAAPKTQSAQTEPVPAPHAPTQLIPGSLRLKYDVQGEVRGLAYQAGGELLWAHNGQDYEARLEIGAFLLGSRVQLSRGRITAAGLQPLRFVDRTRRERNAEFDHAAGLVRFSEGMSPAVLEAGAQDQLSIFIQLGSLLATDPARFAAGGEVSLQAVGIRDAQRWRFEIGAPEMLSLPGGEVLAHRLTRQVRRGEDALRVELWLAPALGWLPARLRLSQPNGDYIDQGWSGSSPP